MTEKVDKRVIAIEYHCHNCWRKKIQLVKDDTFESGRQCSTDSFQMKGIMIWEGVDRE